MKMTKMVIKFLLVISLVCAVRGFPEGEKEITSNIKRIKATPAIPSAGLKDLEDLEKYGACPDPNFHCNYYQPVCVCGGNCCPIDQPNYFSGYCYAVDY